MTANHSHGALPAIRIVGTAGHVDHGKSSLVKALTGTDPDRLAEEKARAMTIELGFAWKQLDDGLRLSFIDVPGHERFIKNMLAGVGGIDAVLLVIAADEGPMPQTREHLAIIDLLGISSGVVALTKSDLVDAEWLDLMTEEIRLALADSTMAGAPIIPCSVVTGAGLTELESALRTAVEASPGRVDRGRPRLSVDRVFSLTGFGTVVTGTLIDGSVRVGDEVVILPEGTSTRVRGLHVHNTRVDEAGPGTRVAMNLAGIALDQVHRGDVIARPGTLEVSNRLDVRLELLPGAPAPLQQDDPVDFFAGAAETPAWLTLLDREQIEPGASGWVQLRLQRPLALVSGDRFIVRRPSPSETIGGGIVVDPAPERHRRFRADIIAALESRERGDPEELLIRAIAQQIVRTDAIDRQAGIDASPASLAAIVDGLLERGLAVRVGADWITAESYWSRLVNEAHQAVEAFHADQPLRRGVPREELKRRLPINDLAIAEQVIDRLAERGDLVDEQRTLRLPDFEIRLAPADRVAADAWFAAIDAAPFAPPSPDTFGLSRSALTALQERGEIMAAGDGIYFTPVAMSVVDQSVLTMLDETERVTLADYRDRVQTSRKYAQAILELLDQRRVTRRVGDDRVRYRTGATPGEGSRD